MTSAPSHVLALEFHGTHESNDFRWLSGRPDLHGTVTRLDPVAAHVRRDLTIGAQAEALLDELAAPPDTVVSYCACAALAAHTASRTGADLVLVEPDVIRARDVVVAYDRICASLGQDPSGVEAIGRGDLDGVGSGLAATVAGRATDLGYTADLADELAGHYVAWLSFLLACSQARPAPVSGRIVVVTTRDHVETRPLVSSAQAPTVRRVRGSSTSLDSEPMRAAVLQSLTNAHPRPRPRPKGPIKKRFTP